MRDLQLDRSVVALRLEGARISADFKEIALYGGQGKGHLDVGSSTAPPGSASSSGWGCRPSRS